MFIRSNKANCVYIGKNTQHLLNCYPLPTHHSENAIFIKQKQQLIANGSSPKWVSSDDRCMNRGDLAITLINLMPLPAQGKYSKGGEEWTLEVTPLG